MVTHTNLSIVRHFVGGVPSIGWKASGVPIVVTEDVTQADRSKTKKRWALISINL